MPWNNQSGGPWGGGGGGNNNSGGGGPWGGGPKGPNGPNGPQNQPPDLEDILRRGQDRLKRALPGGSGDASPAIFGLILLALVAGWAFKAVYTVQPDEVGVEALFGKPKADLSESGLHFHWWPIETVEKVRTAEKLIPIGGGSNNGNAGLMLSGDQNIVNVQFSVAYRVSNPKDYLFNVESADDMARQISESAMREVVGRRPAQDIFRDNRQAIADDVRSIVQSSLDDYGAGLTINAVSIEDASPPREVADAFNDVQRAEQDEDRYVEEANAYSNQQLGQARGQAAQITEQAAGYKNQIVEEAKGEAQRFLSVQQEYAKAPAVTRERLYLETMEHVLQGTNKVIMAPGAQNILPYLPLPALQPRPNPPSALPAQPAPATPTPPQPAASAGATK